MFIRFAGVSYRRSVNVCSGTVGNRVVLGEILTFKRRIKSHLPFAGIIRSSPYSTGFQDKGLRLFSRSQKYIMKYK